MNKKRPMEAWSDQGNIGPAPPGAFFLITEAGEDLITEAGEFLVTE